MIGELGIEIASRPSQVAYTAGVEDVAPLVEWGVVLQAMKGHSESGDQYLVKSFSSGVLVAAVDGLGHGDKAAAAAKAAVAVLERYAHESVELLVKRCHQELIGSRGVVMSLASFSAVKSTMTWLGVGNVQGLLLHPEGNPNPVRQSLLLRGGTVGYRLPTLRATVLTVRPGDTLIFVSDGIRSGFIRGLDLTRSPQGIADRIYEDHARGTDDTLVLVARYIGEALDAGI